MSGFPSSAHAVLVYDADGTVCQATPQAASHLDTTPSALLDGTATVPLPKTVPAPTLSALAQHIIETGARPDSLRLPDGTQAHISRARGRGDKPTVIVSLRAPSPDDAHTTSPPDPDLQEAQYHLLNQIARGAPLPSILADCAHALEREHPHLRVALLRRPSDSNTFEVGAAPSLPSPVLDRLDDLPTASPHAPALPLLPSEAPTVTPDILADDEWQNLHTLARQHDLRACWAVPIHGSADAGLGILAAFYDTPHPTTPLPLARLKSLSRVAGIALERDRQEHELSVHRNQIQRLVENAQPMICILDAEGTVLVAEGDDLDAFGSSPGETVGQSVYEAYADAPAVLHLIDKALDGHTTSDIIAYDGATFDIWYAPYYDADGTIAGAIGMAIDITQRRDMEDELRNQKAFLQSVTENVSDGIYRSTHEDGLVYANSAFVDMFGYDSIGEMMDLSPDALYADPSIRSTLIEREREQGGIDGMEVTYQRKDGSTFVGLLRTTQVLETNGSPQYHDGVITDITPLKEREATLRQQRTKIKSLYAPPDDLLDASTRPEVAARLVSLVHDTFGYPAVTVRYLQNQELVPVRSSTEVAAHMPDRPTFDVDGPSAVARTFRQGESRVKDDARALDDPYDYGEVRAVAGIPLGGYGIVTLASFEVGGIDAFDLRLIEVLAEKATAVLERIEREAALEASEQRFRGLFEEAALGIALADEEGRIIESNPELRSMLEYDAESLEGRPFSALTHPADRNRDLNLFRAVVDGDRERYDLEKRYVRSDGSSFWAQLTVSRRDGSSEGQVIAMIEDVSARKAYEQRLERAKQAAEEASQLKSALLANMSHEIRTPLTSVIGFAEILKDQLEGEHQERATLIHDSSRRLMETLDSVLKLSRLEAGAIDLEPEPMDLVEEVDSTLSMLAPQAEARSGSLTFDPSVERLRVCQDRTAIQRVVMNLVGNALKFTPDDGSITVSLHAAEDGAVLEVADTGVGMTEEFQSQLFDAFTQESGGRERSHEGSGLGLAIVDRLVGLMDGSIEVESTKGVGTRFRVTLPHG